MSTESATVFGFPRNAVWWLFRRSRISRQQLAQEQFCTLLLNGAGIMKAYENRLHTRLTEATALRSGRVRFFTGTSERGLKVVGWNINLHSSFGVSGEEIQGIAAAARSASR